MGLAASQARLLTITARKADCEFQSMTLSHEKIALSRDMEKISDEYQNATNQTKLVYDYYGTGTSQMNLNYGLLMSPSVYNDYYPKLITDNKNRVVLSDKYADAAKKAGIPAEGFNGTPSSEVRNKFIEALRDNGTISAATAANVESVSYNNAVGLGATFSASETTQDITYTDLMDMIKSNCADTSDYGLSFTWRPAPGQDYSDYLKQNSGSYPNPNLLSHNSDDNAFVVVDGDTSNRATKISLYDLLNDTHQYTYASKSAGVNYPLGEAIFLQQLIAGSDNSNSFLNWMTEQFQSILGGVNTNDQALQYAYDQVYDIIIGDGALESLSGEVTGADYGNANKKRGASSIQRSLSSAAGPAMRDVGTNVHTGKNSNISDVVNTTNDYIGMTYTTYESTVEKSNHHKTGNRKECAINLNNLAKVFLTAYVEYEQGMSNKGGVKNSKYSYDKGQTADGRNGTIKYNLYEPKDDDVFTIKAPTDVDTGSSNLEAGFYDALFNRICVSGWTENDNITNADYMQDLLKSGAVYISSIDNDGNYYQSSYSTDTYISEVTDTEGVAQAEAKYNAAKAKIENKENTIDTKMKNLDTEISSLTTEYDTMKNVINKAIEKSFKRYDA